MKNKNRIWIFLAVGLQLLNQQNALAQNSKDNKQQFASLGNFALENGQQIVDCKIGYRTFGKLNANKTNTVIYPTAGGMTTRMMQMFGQGREVDTTKFYLILIDALGNGISSSPSNSSSQPKTLFPQFTIRDMVDAQYKMLAEKMELKHIAAVIGGSLGGIQAMQWAVSYPDYMDKIIAIEGTPKVSTYDLLWMHAYATAVQTDSAYHDGNYTTNPDLPLATVICQLILTTPTSLNKSVSTDSLFKWLPLLENNPFKVDANNMLWQTKAVMQHDITAKFNGSLENTAKAIKAKMLIIANKQDHNINQALSIKFAEMVNSEKLVLDDDLGHLIFGEKVVVDATRKFLAE